MLGTRTFQRPDGPGASTSMAPRTAVYACATLFQKSAFVALVCNFKFCCKNDDFSRCFVDF